MKGQSLTSDTYIRVYYDLAKHELKQAVAAGESLLLDESPLPGAGRVLSLAPHPDDPDAVGVTLRLLAQGGWKMYWGIVTSGWSGVQDDFAGPEQAVKSAVREAEQRAAARFFGLPEERLTFLWLAENAEGNLAATAANRKKFNAYLTAIAPDLVQLPHMEDTHPTHRLVYQWFAAWATACGRPVLALGNADPKTIAFRPDLLITFGAETAAWKAELLECHRSQSARNQATRGITFAERILAVNRALPGLPAGRYAERFQVAQWP